ncbi:MAG: response regulator [Bacteroidetes bacterium]|nr:response regulator [Bacteroidota bacterium]
MKLKTNLNCVILIDDDDPTNYYHKMIIEQYGCAEKILIFTGGEKALQYLLSNTQENTSYLKPDLIFLDINMPRMTGWDFLKEYAKLPDEQKSRIVLMMLTTSLNPDDETLAHNTPDVSGFYFKPLSNEMLDEILIKHFAANL